MSNKRIVNKRIVGWDIKLSIEWSDKPNKREVLTVEDIPEWLAQDIDKFLDAVEKEDV